MALTPEQLKLMSAASLQGPGSSQPNTTMMGFFNNGQPVNLDQMNSTGPTAGVLQRMQGDNNYLDSPEYVALRAAEAKKEQDYYNNRPYQGDHAYKNVFNNYMRSDMYDKSGEGFNPFGENIGGTGAGFKNFLEQEQKNIMNRSMQMNVKPQSFYDYSNNIDKAYNEFNPITNQASMDEYFASDEYLNNPDKFAQLAGDGDRDPRGVQQRKYDDGYFNNGTGNNPGNLFNSMPSNPNPGDLVGGPAPQEPGQEFNTTDIFGAGNNPIMNNPIAPMPSPITPPGGMNSGHSHGDLLSGIGKLFEQYFPQQGGSTQFNQPGAQPTFDATGNSVSGGQTQSNQVFGNMITPDFGGGY